MRSRFLQCDYEQASAYLRTGLGLVSGRGDDPAAAAALQRLGSIAREQGHYDDALDLHRQSLAIWERLGDARGVAASRNYLGFVHWLVNDTSTAEAECGAALAEFTRLEILHDVVTTLINLGAAALYGADLELARGRLREALAIATRLGFQEGIAWSLHELAIVGRRAGRAPSGLAPMLRDALSSTASSVTAGAWPACSRRSADR